MTQKLWLRSRINFVLKLVLFMLISVFYSALAKGRAENGLSILQNSTFNEPVLISGPIAEFEDKWRNNIRQRVYGPLRHKREKNVGGVRNKTFVIGYLTGSDLHSTDRHYMRPGLQISGAITLAVKEINEQRPLVDGHKLDFVVAETYGQELESIMQTAQLWLKNISAYIGPQETCVYEAKMAAAFQLPMLSYFCTNSETSDKKKFPTFARTRPPDTQISKSVASVLKKFHWKKVIFLYNNSPEEDFGRVAETIQATLLLHNITVLATKVWNATYFHLYMENIFYAMLKDTFKHCRIYVALGYYYEFLGIMSTMEEQGLFSKGEYFVIGVMLQEYNRLKPEQYLQDFLNEATNITLQNAYQNFLGVIPTAPVGLEKFHEKVDYYLGLPPFNYPNAVESLGGIKRIRPEASYLYDAVNLYAKSLNETLQLGSDPCNGTEIIRRLLGTTYFSSRGYMVHMDMHGDAEGNYTLLSRFPLESRSSDFGLYPVGDFRYSIEYFGLPELHLTKMINWKKGHPPIDEPPCGFRGEKCFYQKTEIVVGVAGGLALLIFIFLVMAYRNWKYEQELDSLLWKINFKDVQGYQPPHNNIQIQSKERVGRGALSLRSSQLSLNSNIWTDPRGTSASTQLGIYKGRVVAMKHFPIKAVEITRKVKKELKMMRDLRHDNIVGFVGACVDSPNICFLSEYCTRGSLKDILENGDVRLDAMFIASLTRDILQGMIFLHDSQIKFHGCLTTTCCLVDSRWVAKIADYGLNSLRGFFEANPLERVNETEASYDLLYRAPELLRDRSIRGTQKGDVFSFAIILYELHARNGPYGALDLPPSTIVDKVKLGPLKAQEPFRPPVSSLDNCLECVRNCLAECWAENPEDRPEFRSIRQKLLPLRKGMKANIFDNMLDIMEKYANNLEVLVEERTDLLIEEKKKTDALLYEMLPRVVAEQLKKGHRVEAENFDCVTIFFSDIVGFTEMSAQSTALQVVDFLNDLYTCFDSIIGYYDVYKVETIGDAYMVVSGLPLRNGDDHAGEIASMSFHLLQSISTFHIRHLPGHKVKLRIGVHSGPVCAGVVGVKMPRYCLFGDTVNTASRMESLGSPLKIHCSSAFRDILTSRGGYTFEERGRIKVKGKGEMTTYWLIGKDASVNCHRESPSNQKRYADESQVATRYRTELRGSIKSMSGHYKNDQSPDGQRRLRFVKSDGILPQSSKQYPSTPTSITSTQSPHEEKNSFSSLKGGSFRKLPSESPDISPEAGKRRRAPFATNSDSEQDSEYEPEYHLVVEGRGFPTNSFTPSTDTFNPIDSDNSFGLGYTTGIKMFSRETQSLRKDRDQVRSARGPLKGRSHDKRCYAQNISPRDLGGNIESPWCDSPARSNCSKILSEIGKSVNGIYEESSPLLTQVTNYNVIKETTLNQDTQL